MVVNEYIQQLSQIQLIIISIMGVALLVQLFYYLFIYTQVLFSRKNQVAPSIDTGVSVIICAKNEEQNLMEFLPKVLAQDYSNFEVIVVNDCSEDNSEMFLAQLELENKNLRHTTINADSKFRHGKKLAISIGIKAAKNNLLVFTDADCYPASKNWLREMVNAYTDSTEIVLAYGKYETRKGLLNKMVRFDTLFIALQYLGFAKLGRPYMGVGRNMSYKKELFYSGKGFANHYHIISGDDDLFINEHAKKKNTKVVVGSESYTCSVPPESFIAWIKQKKRHLSTAKHYKFFDKFMLGLEPFSKMVFYLAIIYLSLSPFWLVAVAFYGFRLLVQLIIIKLGMNKLGEKRVLLLIPFLDIFLPLFHLILIFSNKKNAKSRKWK